MLYTPMPLEIVFQNLGQDDIKMVNQIKNGVPIQIMVSKDGTARIERILSTNPQDYLNAELQPGQVITY